MGCVALVYRWKGFVLLLLLTSSTVLIFRLILVTQIQIEHRTTQGSSNLLQPSLLQQLAYQSHSSEQVRHKPKPSPVVRKPRPVISGNVRTIRFVSGDGSYTDWLKKTDLVENFLNTSADVCGYQCYMELGDSHAGMTDMAVFFGVHLPKTVTRRTRPDQVWLFYSEEPPDFIPVKIKLNNWNGLFNYTFSFGRFSEASSLGYVFSTPVIKRQLTLKRNFAKEKQALLSASEKKTTADILWFVSNCYKSGSFKVKSNRMEYAHVLFNYITIDAFTGRASRAKTCTKQLRHLAKNESELDPQYNDYWFYLAFENCYCKDYITEKFWKILVQDTLTIPVVMGGTSIEQYTRIAPPNSFIHVANFTSPKNLAEHLHYVMANEDAFNYYHQWRNEYEVIPLAAPLSKGKPTLSSQELSPLSPFLAARDAYADDSNDAFQRRTGNRVLSRRNSAKASTEINKSLTWQGHVRDLLHGPKM